MRIDMPTCQYGEDHCRKRFDGNCLLNPDLLDERCPIRRTINDVLEIVDEVADDYKSPTASGLGHSVACKEIRKRVLKMRGDKE